MGPPGKPAPLSFLVPFDAELMPGAIVERLFQVLLPARALLLGADPVNLLLQKVAHGLALSGRPGHPRTQQALAYLLQARGPVIEGLPLEAQGHSHAGGPLFQLLVHASYPTLALVNQVVQVRRHLADEVALKHLPFARV